MSQFGGEREANDGVRNIYTGVENFRVLSVNPSYAQLKELYGENAKDDVYIGESEVDGVKYPQLKIVFHCDNDPGEGEDKIIVRPTFWVTNAPLVSKEKGSKQYINLYGRTIWLQDEDANQNKPTYENVGTNGTYVFDGKGMRLSLRGESEFIDFFRNLLNLPSPDKANDPMEAASQFSMDDWKKAFAGDFSVFQNVIKASKNKVGLLLGAKSVEDKIYQDIFTRQTLRQYAKGGKRFEYLLRQLDDAVANGAYPNTNWGPRDCMLRIYNSAAPPTTTDVFKKNTTAATSSFFSQETADAFSGSK